MQSKKCLSAAWHGSPRSDTHIPPHTLTMSPVIGCSLRNTCLLHEQTLLRPWWQNSNGPGNHIAGDDVFSTEGPDAAKECLPPLATMFIGVIAIDVASPGHKCVL